MSIINKFLCSFGLSLFLASVGYTRIISYQSTIDYKPLQTFLKVHSDLSFKLKHGTQTKTNLVLDLFAIYNRYQHFFLFDVGSELEVNLDNLKSRVIVHSRYIYQLSSLIGFEGFVQYEFNDFKFLERRALGGLGIRLTPYRGELVFFVIGISYMFENIRSVFGIERFNHRLNNYYFLQVGTKKYSGKLTFYVQPKLYGYWNVGGTYNLVLLLNLETEIEIDKHVSLVLGYNLHYQSKTLSLYNKELDGDFSCKIRVRFDKDLSNKKEVVVDGFD